MNDWLADNPRVTLHFTATSCSWLNMVEIFFGIITRQCLKRGAFSSVRRAEKTMERYIENYNLDAKPFTWTKSAGLSSGQDETQNKPLTRSTSVQSVLLQG